MAQLPKELHETILAEVMRRKRLAENVAINAVWRVSALSLRPGPAHDAASCESALEPSEASLGCACATLTIGRRRAWGRTWLAGGPPPPRLARLPRDETTVFSLVRRSFRGALEARLAELARRRSPYFRARSLPLRFLAVNAIRIRWEILRACIF